MGIVKESVANKPDHGISDIKLSNDELKRYSRHLLLQDVGFSGQRKLKDAKVLLIGLGGLGSPIAVYLASTGIGQLGLIDFDTVDASNLHRQIIHYDNDIGRPKIDSAEETIRRLNPHVKVKKYNRLLTSENALDIISQYDIICDGTDNFSTRYLVNDACYLLGKPNVYGSIFLFEGQATVFNLPDGPCYRCVFPNPPDVGDVPSCGEAGVLGVLPGIIGLVQATEVIKLIIGRGKSLSGSLLLYDALDMVFRKISIVKDPNCPLCGVEKKITELIDYNEFCGIDIDSINYDEQISVEAFSEIKSANVPHILIDVREIDEVRIGRIEPSIHIPLSQISKLFELNLEKDILVVIYCRSGFRSRQAIQILKQQGISNLKNLAGGILKWSELIDNEIFVY